MNCAISEVCVALAVAVNCTASVEPVTVTGRVKAPLVAENAPVLVIAPQPRVPIAEVFPDTSIVRGPAIVAPANAPLAVMSVPPIVLVPVIAPTPKAASVVAPVTPRVPATTVLPALLTVNTSVPFDCSAKIRGVVCDALPIT